MRTRALLLTLALGACGEATGPEDLTSRTGLDAGRADSSAQAPDTATAVETGPLDMGTDDRVEVTFRVIVPRDTPIVPEVHIAGDFQGWDPSSEAHRLTRELPNQWAITLRLPPGPIEYKYARGDWTRVEKDAGGGEIANRQAVLTMDTVIEDEVAVWSDRPPAPSTIVGDVRELEALGRRVLVYLPPGYEQSDARYPVLYMFDGQNVFDARTAFAGEWQADEAAERLIAAEEIEPLIIVAIANGGADRIREYTPWRDEDFSNPGGGGQDHLQAIVDTILPLVDRTFRTRTGRRETAICGSSLGGLMAAYAAFAHADEFGRVAAVSPSIWWDERRLIRFVNTESRPAATLIYADMGTAESGGIPALRALRDALVRTGFTPEVDLFVSEVEGAGHNENAWRARFPAILRRLFPAR